jgi:O-methyltransferase
MAIMKALFNKLKNWGGISKKYAALPGPRPPWEIPEDLFRVIHMVQSYSLCDPLRLSTLYGLTCEVRGRIKGDIVECGVFNGGSAAVMGFSIAGYPDHRLWLYDTFEGMPPPAKRDNPLAEDYTGKLQGSLASVKEILTRVRLHESRCRFQKGLFKETFKGPLPERVALLHIDADWYDSVRDALETFYPRMPDGGIVVLDDFGHWEGAREAFYDFCMTNGIKPLLERIGYTQCFWRKGKKSNRQEAGKYLLGLYRPHFR